MIIDREDTLSSLPNSKLIRSFAVYNTEKSMANYIRFDWGDETPP